MNVSIVTLGCSKNSVDSEVIAAQLKANNIGVSYETGNNNAGTVIINTCGFIENAKKESVDAILRYAMAKKQGSIEKLIVTGCLSERFPDELRKEMPEVDAFFGTNELPSLLHYLDATYLHELSGQRELTTPVHYAYLKISEGCDRGCSFCAIPSIRGKHRSKSIDDLVDEAKNLAKKGTRELILIAQDTSSYGMDIYGKSMLSGLLNALSAVKGIFWIRLHYAYPARFPLNTLDVINEKENICKYLDLPLQHISDKMLFAMRRGIDRKRTMKLIETIRKKVPGIALRTTFLVGFPGETEEDFTELCSFIEEMKFERAGVFEYSHEEGTNSYLLEDNIPAEIKHERADAVMRLQSGISMEHNRTKTGKVLKVIFDRKEGGFFIGRTEYDSPEVDNEVLVDAEKNYVRIGDFSKILITAAEEFQLFGIPAVEI